MNYKMPLILLITLGMTFCASSQKKLGKQRANDPQYQYNVGLVYLQNGKHDEAITYFNKSLSLKPNFDLLRDKIGLVHMRDLGFTDYPYLELLTLLKESGYNGFCLAEIAGSEEPERIMQYYAAVWRAYQQLLAK